MAYTHVFLQIPYRQTEGFARKLATFTPTLRAADYTILFRRIILLNLSLNVKPDIRAKDVVIAVDITGGHELGRKDAGEMEIGRVPAVVVDNHLRDPLKG